MPRAELVRPVVEREVRERDALTIAEKELAAKALSKDLGYLTGCRQLELDEGRSLGSKDSAHDVFFIESPPDRTNNQLNFAVKRFRRPENAAREMKGFAEARLRGFATLTPVGQGIFPVDEIGHLLVTEHVPRFTTMDHMGWRDIQAGQEDYERRGAGPLRRIGTSVSRMHSMGIAHGDAQLKNIGENQLGRPLLFDLEDAVFEDPNDIDDFDYVSKVGDDLNVLMCSLVDRGFLWSATDAVFEAEITDKLIDPYLGASKINSPELIDFIHHGFEEAMTKRVQLHSDFSSRIGLPS